MKEWRYKLHVENCRAIKTADICLSEITVLSGVNASGKSTIAKMFRDLIEASVGYERLLSEKFWYTFFGEWVYSLNEGARHLENQAERETQLAPPSLSAGRLLAHGKMTFSEAVGALESKLAALVELLKTNDSSSILTALKRRLGVKGEDESLLDAFTGKKRAVLSLFDDYIRRPRYECYKGLPLYSAVYEGRVEFHEGDSLIYSNADSISQAFTEIKWIRRAIYIESPFKSMPTSSLSEELKMGDSFTRIRNNLSSIDQRAGRDLFQVLSGGVEYEEQADSALNTIFMGEEGKWLYRRDDGKSFDLKECATGIRAFSILNALFTKGWLDSETLLIIDEPEAHLHPQWIVEYARLLLLLSVKFKVRLLLTSHSPDMVNAIHTIGTAMGLSGVMDFYLAEKDDNDAYMFNYRSLGCNVGDIFKAYNVSFKTINEYAEFGRGK